MLYVESTNYQVNYTQIMSLSSMHTLAIAFLTIKLLQITKLSAPNPTSPLNQSIEINNTTAYISVMRNELAVGPTSHAFLALLKTGEDCGRHRPVWIMSRRHILNLRNTIKDLKSLQICGSCI